MRDEFRGRLDMFSEQHDEVYRTLDINKASLSHELIAGAASYEAAKAYEKHCQEKGKPVDHSTAKTLLSALSGAFVDRLVETKGLDFIDRQKAKRHAEDQVNQYYDEQH